MASNKDAASFDLTVDFNRVNLALAKRQSMLASLMGLSSAAKQPDNSVPEEASDDFTAEPELLGIGAKKQEDDKDASQILSSEIRLKRQLLPKGFDKRQAATRLPVHGQKGGLAGGPISRGRATSMEKLPYDDLDSDEDVGRSSLGKRKREKREQAGEIPLESGKDEKKQKVPQPSSDLEPVHSSPLMEQMNKIPTDIAPSEAIEKKRKKKKKKKSKTQAQEELPSNLGLR